MIFNFQNLQEGEIVIWYVRCSCGMEKGMIIVLPHNPEQMETQLNVHFIKPDKNHSDSNHAEPPSGSCKGNIANDLHGKDLFGDHKPKKRSAEKQGTFLPP